mgnify:CR=1 FL=1
MKENKFIKDHVQFGTKEVFEWDSLTISSYFKEKYRKNESEREIVSAYMEAAKSIYIKFHQQTNPTPGLKVMRTNQMCIPFLYMCRHTIELSIKYKLNLNNIEYDKVHKLKDLWRTLNDNFKIENEDYNELIEALDIIDNDGCKLRYAVDKKNNEYNSRPLFIKADSILATTKEIYESLIK